MRRWLFRPRREKLLWPSMRRRHVVVRPRRGGGGETLTRTVLRMIFRVRGFLIRFGVKLLRLRMPG